MRYLFIFLLMVVIGACNNQPMVADATATNDSDEKLSKLFDTYWEERMRLYPLEATQNGDNRYNDRLSLDISEPFRDTLRTFYTNYLTQVQQFDRAGLSENDQISYDIFKREMEMQLEGLQLNEHLIPFQQFWGTPLTIGQLGSGESSQPFKNAQDYRNWLSRVKTFAIWADTAIANFRKGIAAGYVLPSPLVTKMIPQMQDMANTDTAKNVFFGPLRKLPKELASDSVLKNEFVTTINTQVLPAYKRLGDFLQNVYLPKARTTTGINATPNGTARYNYLIRYWTTTDETADEIYNTGMQEVARIRSEMEKIKTQVGFRAI